MAADRSRGFSLKTFERGLAEKKPAPVYFFYGPEEYRIKRAAAAVKKRILKEADPLTGWTVYDLAETDFSQIIAYVRTVSFFGGLRGVAVTNLAVKVDRDLDVDANGAEKPNALDEEDQKRLMEYIKNPSPDVVLLLITQKIDKRKKFWKELAAEAKTVNFETKDKKQLVTEILLESGLQFDNESRKWVMENFEHSCRQLESEFQKLEVYLGGRKEVSLSDLEECMNTPRTESVFNLTKAIGSGKMDESLLLLKMLKSQGEILQMVTALIARQFRIFLILESLGGENLPQNELARRCGVPPYYLDEYRQQARNFSLAKLKWILLVLSSADIKMKSSSLDGWMILEDTVISLIPEEQIAPQAR